MDFKVLISNSGEESLFTTLSTELERRLPKSAVEWKRSYGRPSKSVILQASFSKFDSSQLSSSLDPSRNLQSKPLLHIFWTSCSDNDYFKSTVKSSILKWQRELQQHQCSDWLIIHVLKQENLRSGKSKIQLPRSSVYDKIKLEFGQKVQERCVQLWEPEKSTLFTKSGESWDSLLLQLRCLLLESFGNYLDSFEDKIRVSREKYADPDWSFVDYFIAHEELALIYQSITLKEDALVQYDEVDALLSQFVINCKGKEPPNWLNAFCATPTCWDGVTLSSSICNHYRDLIKSGKASLLDFRNYLFSRQCKLLIKMKRSWEIPLRLTDFLFAMVHEFSFLKIPMDSGMISCWIVLSCMQLFQVLEVTENKDRAFYSSMAGLHDYLCLKLYVIGQITGLYYNRKQTEAEIKNVNKLLSGVGKFHASKKDPNSFVKSLKSALQSHSEFGEIYIATANKCMELYKELNYKHFSVRIGAQLARYYLEHEQYLNAEFLLEEAWNIYKQQKWEALYTDVLIPLADCQFKHKRYKQYLHSVSILACSQLLDSGKKLHYNEEFIRLLNSNDVGNVSAEPAIKVEKISIPLVKGKGHIGDNVSIQVRVNFKLRENLLCQRAEIHLKYFDLNSLSPSYSLAQCRGKHESTSSKMIIPSAKQTNETSVKAPFTQNTLLKRMKDHRRTWSRNKNIADLNESDSLTVATVTANSTKSSCESIPLSLENSKRNITSNECVDLLTCKKIQEEGSQFVMENLSSSCESISKSSSTGNIFTYEMVVESTDVPTKSTVGSTENKQQSLTDLSKFGNISIDKENLAAPVNSSFDILSAKNEKDQTMMINNLILTYGTNDLVFSTKINFEGKFLLSHIDFYISNTVFTQTLKLDNLEKSFSMVVDPPKIEWTSDYLVDSLLTGNKERLYVTLLNGPGVIVENSVLNIFSNSGLAFYAMSITDVCIFPLERNQPPRYATISIESDGKKEAALILPYCQPYERINIFFDVIAPLENGEKTTIQHEITFACSWLKDLISVPLRLDCIFYEPFQIKYETIPCGVGFFVKITLCGVNPVELLFSKPRLVAESEDMFNLLHTTREIILFGSEEHHLIWRYDQNPKNIDVHTIDCTFIINFKQSKDDMQSSVYSKALTLNFSKCLYSLQIIMDDCELVKSNPFRFEITITKKQSDFLDKLYLMRDPSDTIWKSNKDMYPILFEDNLQTKIHIELNTEQSGQVPWPRFMLSKVYAMEVEGDAVSFDMITGFQRHEVSMSSMARILFIKSD